VPFFKENLIKLLPSLYRHSDKSGDLQSFLSLPAGVLDQIKEKIDNFPDIFDAQKCDERFLPLLAYMVGHTYDGTDLPENQRTRIQESIEIYRRKGTPPAIDRSLKSIGWNGNIEETYKSALRLNSRSRISSSKLPGNVYSLGVYRIHNQNQTKGLRKTLSFHHPAGTGVFFLQWLSSLSDSIAPEFLNATVVRRVILSFLNETFVVGRNKLSGCNHLNSKKQIHHYIQLTSAVLMLPEIDHAAIKVSRFHGRQNRMRLNSLKTLNKIRLTNTSIREDSISFCTPIYTKNKQRTVKQGFVQGLVKQDFVQGFVLAGSSLNNNTLSISESHLTYCFRQKDFFSVSEISIAAFLTQEVSINNISGKHFQSGQSQLNSTVINGIQGGISSIVLMAVANCKAVVAYAHDLLNRWRIGSVFKLNSDVLNNWYLPNLDTGQCASLEVYAGTNHLLRQRVVPLNLNNRPLNKTSLRLSVDRKTPLRIGGTKLNQAGFRLSDPTYRWLLSQ